VAFSACVQSCLMSVVIKTTGVILLVVPRLAERRFHAAGPGDTSQSRTNPGPSSGLQRERPSAEALHPRRGRTGVRQQFPQPARLKARPLPYCVKACPRGFVPGRARNHERRSIRAEGVSHHVASDVRRSELRTQTVQLRAVIVGDGNYVALCHAHAG
jgi:hypothetical protein